METKVQAAKDYAEKRMNKYTSPILNELMNSDDLEDSFLAGVEFMELKFTSGVNLINEERQRQIEVESYTLEHDLGYVDDELAYAAVCYAIPGDDRLYEGDIPELWPWDKKFWKPAKCEFSHDENYISERVLELQKAGALIVAEIDRINTKKNKSIQILG